MASIKDLKKRIVSVKNTQQTTKAMKMVSAAKLRRAQEAINNQRPYAQKLAGLLRQLASLPDLEIQSPFVAQDAGDTTDPRTLLLVLFTSDRGLCAGFNSNIIKAAQRFLAANNAKYARIELGFVGKRGYDFFKTKKVNVGPFFAEITGKMTFAKAKKLSDQLTGSFKEGQYSEIKVIYNEFKNAVTQEVKVEDFLPVRDMTAKNGGAQPSEAANGVDYLVEPNAGAVFGILLEKNFVVQAFRYLLESQAGEHGARMSAMENATNNADDMIRQLTLDYNKQRQAGITKELLEIIGGSESQKAS